MYFSKIWFIYFNLYYSDTDSIYIDRPLNENFISSTILGKMKLENIVDKAIFLSPKVYCLETENKEFIYKVKGLSHEIKLNFEDFIKLLKKDAILKKDQEKFFRSLSKGHIELMNQIYTLQVTDNKRKLIYNKNSKLIGTKPYIIDFYKMINN